MKKIYQIVAAIVLFAGIGCSGSDAILKLIGGGKISMPGDIVLKEKQEKIDSLEKGKEVVEAEQRSFNANLKGRLGELDQQFDSVRNDLVQSPGNEFLLEKQVLLNDLYRVLKDKQKIFDVTLEHMDANIEILQDYLSDPNFERFKQELKDESTSSFEFIRTLSKRINEQQQMVDLFSEQEKTAVHELENRRRLVKSLKDGLEKKKKEVDLSASNEEDRQSLKHRGELFAIEGKLYKEKIEFEELRLKEIEHKLSYSKAKLFIARTHLEILKNVFSHIKSLVRINEAEIAYDKDELAKEKQRSFRAIDTYQREVEQISVSDGELREKSKSLNVPLGTDLDEWSREPKSVESYNNLLEVGSLNEGVQLRRRMRDDLEAKIAAEKEHLAYDTLQVDIKESYYYIVDRRFESEERVHREMKKYNTLLAGIKADSAQYESKRATFAALLASENKALENIKERERTFLAQKDTLFKLQPREFSLVAKKFHESIDSIKRKIKLLEEIVDIYSALMARAQEAAQQINFVMPELETAKFWYRPEQAISWNNIKSIGPDLERFAQDIRTYFSRIRFSYILNVLYMPFDSSFALFRLLLIILFILALLYAFKLYAPRINQMLIEANKSYRGLRTITLLFGLFSSFFSAYFVLVATWIVLYMIGRIYAFSDPYLYAFFYLASIPLFLYFSYRFIQHVAQFNEQRGYLFLSKGFQNRFVRVLAALLYATSVIILFRKAFMLINYQRSELPTILLALNFIILQVSVILLIDKEQFLNLIPTRTAFWEWIHKKVDDYYYLILILLITIIVLSNPYVGFGRILLYVISRLIYTALLLNVLFWAHDFLKRVTTSIFFQVKDDSVRERFSYAKTWYGLFVVIMLFAMIAGAFIVIAKLWGWPESLVNIAKWEDIRNLLSTPLLFKGSDNPVSLLSFLQIVMIVIAGIFVSVGFERFVLNRIFDVLFVEPGVQHAISSIMSYLIILIAIVAGLQTAGLSHIWYVVLSVGLAFSWVIKDTAFDLFSYFIILVQRPVKIGDYIRFDEDIRGVVRRITPRAVILRRRNSSTVIVPNSQIMTRSFTNWSYSRGFTAFDDIFLTVGYDEDPSVVQEVILNVLRSNQYVLKSPAPIVRLYRFGAYGFVFQIRGFLSSNYTLDMWGIASDMRLAIVKAFKENNIKFGSVRAPDIVPGSALGQGNPAQPALPAEFLEHRNTDE